MSFRNAALAGFVLAAALAGLLLSACQREPVSPVGPADPERAISQPVPGAYLDITASSGVAFEYRNGEEADHHAILETLGGGVALFDYDRDGRLDIFVTGGGSFGGKDRKAILGRRNALFRNLGNNKFRDVTAEVALDGPLFYSHGCAVGDYDNDGWPDLLVTGYGRLALYRNERGQRFTESSERAGLQSPGLHWSTSAAWADFDGDGHLDLFVAHYVNWSFRNHPPCQGYGPDQPVDVCPPHRFDPLPQRLFLNNGDGTFREAGASAGLLPGKALGCVALDFDGDGRLDLYVANDQIPNHLYLNAGGGKFVEKGHELGAALGETGEPDGSMGVDAADIDGAGRFSLFVTNFLQQSHALYRNQGKQGFTHVSSRAGIKAIGQSYVGWGTCFFDFDRDGDEDLFISNGHIARHPPSPQTREQRAILFENLGAVDAKGLAHYQDASARAGAYFQKLHAGRGVAFGDLDNDGRIDLVLSRVNAPVAVLRNITPGNQWLGVELVGGRQRDAVGAVATLEVGGRRLHRTIKGGGSYLSASDRRIVFGLGAARDVDQLTVKWPSGRVETWGGKDLAAGRYHRLVEGNAPR